MSDNKSRLFQEVEDMRLHLWKVTEAIDPDTEIYPGWNLRDFFAHVAGWEAMVFEAIRDSFAGKPPKPYPYKGAVDQANADFVARRRTMTLDDARLECEINRFAILTLLDTISAEDFDQPIQLPWGKDPAAQFMRDAIQHERDHADDLVKLQIPPK